MKFFVENWFKFGILILFSLSVLSGTYYFYIFKPQLAVNQQEQATQNTLTNTNNNVGSRTENLSSPSKTVTAKLALTASTGAQSTDTLPQTTLKKIMERIVLVKCYGTDGVSQGSGTAQLINSDDPIVVTNFHVLAGGIKSTCTVNLPKIPDYSLGELFAAEVGMFDSHYPDVDAAVLHAGNVPVNSLTVFSQFPLPFCDESKVEIGNKVTLFGYPSFGSNTLTVTDGIISGFITKKYGVVYKTSAKVDHGISGGLAILNKVPCVLGIPTWAEYNSSLLTQYGIGETLGQIQSWSSIQKSGDIFGQTYQSQQLIQQSSPSPKSVYSQTPSAPVQNTVQDDQLIAENYYQSKKTCVGLSGRQYDFCITYAYNQ